MVVIGQAVPMVLNLFLPVLLLVLLVLKVPWDWEVVQELGWALLVLAVLDWVLLALVLE
jgi:hypothetical protein